MRVVYGSVGSVQQDVLSVFEYGAFGGRKCSLDTSRNGSCQIHPSFGYTGQYQDQESGLVYLRARYYHPQSQQFISRDPLEASTGQPYVYAYGNPVNVVDPTGLEGWGNTQIPPGVGGIFELLGRAGASMNAAGWEGSQFGGVLQLASGHIGPERQLTSGIPWEGKGWDPVVGNGKVYSVAYETRLSSSDYPKVSEAKHFQIANRNLLRAMDADPQFAKGMDTLIPGLRRFLAGPKGGIPRRSPPGWTWHHAAEPGLLQLVPYVQHKPGSILQRILHPGGKGGYYIWGK